MRPRKHVRDLSPEELDEFFSTLPEDELQAELDRAQVELDEVNAESEALEVEYRRARKEVQIYWMASRSAQLHGWCLKKQIDILDHANKLFALGFEESGKGNPPVLLVAFLSTLPYVLWFCLLWPIEKAAGRWADFTGERARKLELAELYGRRP